jgi:NitT/TauT family transport system ATP-binding protein
MAEELSPGPARLERPVSDDAEGLRVENLSIVYAKTRSSAPLRAVKDVSFTVRPREMISLIGPSGCGKSSILSALAGLVPYQGRAEIFGEPITGPASDRAFVFQAASLLPWRTVERNIRYGLELQHVPKKEAVAATEKVLELIGLTRFKDMYPGQLSGGMQQRVNFARALVGDPVMLLMDEPFAALDAQTRERLQLEIVDIWQKSDKLGVFVTHQIDEAVFIADQVVVLSPGPESQVVRHFDIPLARPRTAKTRSDPEFLELVTALRRIFDLA